MIVYDIPVPFQCSFGVSWRVVSVIGGDEMFALLQRTTLGRI
jgi:hypothetical protein